MLTHRVVVLQEYIPQYRVPFFRQLISVAAERGIEVVVGAGAPGTQQAARGDDADTSDFSQYVPQREFSLGSRRITVRNLSAVLESADAVVIEQARRNLDAYRLLLPRRTRRQQFAFWGHGKDFVASAGAVRASVQRVLTNRADWFFAYTQAGADAVRTQGFPHNRITVLNNAIDSRALNDEVTSVTEAEVRQLASTHGLTGDVAVYIGGLDRDKRIGFLLDAAAVVASRRPSFQLAVAGAGPDADLVQRAAAEFEWVNYLGPQFGRAKAVLLRAAKCLAIPGRVGLVAVDSLSACVPIATTAWRWHAPEFEYLRDGENALIAHDSVADYANALEMLVFDEHLNARLRSGAANDWPNYTVEAMALKFAEGLKGMLDG